MRFTTKSRRRTCWWLLLWAACLFHHAASQAEQAISPDQPTLRFDEIGIYEVGYRLRGAAETRLPTGWTGGLDSPTGAACEEGGTQNGQNAWLLHCPWKGKTGTTYQEFTVALPTVSRITLGGSTALRTSAVGKSDGVTFRVLVDGAARVEPNRRDDTWVPFAVDLSASAGRTVTVRFEVDPGPRDDSSFDFALWADRRLEMPGFTPTEHPHPTPPALDLSALRSQQNGSVVPPSGFAAKNTIAASPTGATFRYEGADGTLEYVWRPGEGDSLLSHVHLRAAATGDGPVEVPLANQVQLDWITPATPLETRLDLPPNSSSPTTAVLTKRYAVAGQTATVRVAATIQGKSLVFDVTCDQPVVRALEGGVWGPVMRRRAVRLPYYTSPVSFLAHENLFAGAFLDWTASGASSQTGTRAIYDPRTDGTRNLLREHLIYTAAWHLDETLPNLPHAPSPYREDLARRVILDIWGGKFADLQTQLHALTDSGFGPGVAIVHDWQFGGYDNKLPQHVPANAGLGGDPAMKSLVESAQRDNIRVALHENYADYYPNAPGFAEENISRRPDGSRELAWLNSGTNVQSFAVRPSSMLPLAESQGSEILRRYGPSAAYLDVHSAVPPAFHVDFAADQPGAGQSQAVRSAQEALWAYERKVHDGPVFGEGNAHWYWSGALDGVEAQFGQGWPDGRGTTAPLLVDFDLLKIHPVQLNHGMGYYERWWAQGPGPRRSLLGLLDQYRMQEIAYGHQGFLGAETWRDLGYAWLESHLLPPVSIRTALADPVAIEYLHDGRWDDATATVKANGDFSRLRVRYDNGVTVWANAGGQPLIVDETNIPPNGWLVRGPGLTAGTTLRQGVVTDQAETTDSVFVNARAASDWVDRSAAWIRPGVETFDPDGPRRFRVTYRWQVDQTVNDDLTCFVHFAPANAEAATEPITFQQDHAPTPPTSRWHPGQTDLDGPWTVVVPPHVAPGDYVWTIGLYGRDGRLALRGVPDAHRRIVLGTLHLAPDGVCSFAPVSADTPDPTPVNPDDRIVDFGSVRTNGSVFLQRVGPDWTLRPFPVDHVFTVRLDAARFGHPADAKLEDEWWQLPLTGEKLYRWPATP